MTAVEWLVNELEKHYVKVDLKNTTVFLQAKEMEKTNIDNKVIHFAEWLTKRHTLELMTLYEYFEEQYYNETYKKE